MIDIKDIQGNVIYSTPINQGSKRKFELMQSDYIMLKFSLDTPIDFPIGSCVDDTELGLFEITDLYKPRYNNSTGGYDYELQFNSLYWKWKNKIFKFTPEVGGQEASWSLTASLDVHMGIFLRNLKALGYTYRGSEFEFSIDSTVENKAMSMTYENMNMLDALSALAESWECEWWVTDNIIHLGRCEYGTPVDFEMGVNVVEMTRSESKSAYATRLYVFGSTRNLPPNYRPVDESVVVNGVVQRRLMLPEGPPYIDAYEGMSEEEAIEEVVILEDVYPKTEGNIDSVETYDRTAENEDGTTTTETFYRFKDGSITFSEGYVLEGEELRIKFESGSLNGMEFGLKFNPEAQPEKLEDSSWNPEAQLFEIVASEDYGRKLPDSTLNPKVGDKYILIGWDSTKIADLGLVSKAEYQLLQEGLKLSAKRKIDPNTYGCKMFSDYMYGLDESGSQDSAYAKHFEVGDKVNLINSVYFANGRQSRIIGYEYNLDYPYDSPVYTVGETSSYSRIGELESKLDALTYAGQTYVGGSGSGVYIIGTNDNATPSNRNAYSALKSDQSFLRKDKEDTAKKKIVFEEGIEVGSDKEGKGITYDKETKKATAIIDELKKLLLLQSEDFLQGELGSGFILKYDKEKKRSYFEIDEILVRKIAYFVSLVIKDLKHVGGSLILSPASMTCSKVEVYDTYYRCYFEQNDGEKTINNEFVAGDLARSQTFNIKEGTSENVSNTYYWRYVVNVGDNFIDLSITDCDSGSGIPKKGDEIVQLGNRNDESRQNAIILSTVGDDAPSIKQYKGIKYYFLSDDNAVTIFSPSGNVIKGNFISASTGKNFDEELKKLQVDWDSVLDQTDKEFTMWFYPYAPTLDNIPASEWTSEELRELHDQDLFFDNSTGSETSGKAYRFEKNDEGNWVWNIVNDAETIKALENAAFANKRLDDIVADNILSSLEKKEVLKEWNSLNASFAENINAASDFSLTVENSYLSGYINAYNSLATYMNGGVSLSGSIPSWLADLSTNQEIDGDEYRGKWTNYYRAESELLNYLSIIAKDKADDAQNSADEAKNSINEIVSDGILSSLEKKEVLREWEEISSAYSLNLSNANENNVDTSLYASAYKALGTYLNNGVEWNSGIPSWLADLSSNQSIDSATYRSKWVDYYDAEIALLEAISNAIKQKAEDAQNAANDAQQEAESKKRVFVSQPTTDSQYDVGDLWVNATYTDGVITYSDEEMVCITAKSKGEAFSINHWRPSNGYNTGISSINGQLELWSKSFNNDGTINETKLVLSDLYSKLSTRVGETEASLELKVEENDVKDLISSATITADQIHLDGYTIINDNFKVDDNGNLAIDGSIISTGKAYIQLRSEDGTSTITMRANTSGSNMFLYLDTPNGSTNLDGNSFSLYDGWGHALLAGNESDVVASFANATGYEQIEIGTSFIRFMNSNADQTVYLSNTSFWMSDLNGTTHYGYTGTAGGLKFYNGLCTGEA